jgi:hypothetical protein
LRRYIAISFAALALLCSCSPAWGDVGIILNDSLDTSVARITGSGHSAVYLSRICPASPVKVRLCRPGENGSVVSNYTTLGEDQPFQWNVVPFNTFVYGVPDPADRPLFASWKIKHRMEANYRKDVLGDYCVSRHCETSGSAEWREMVGATSERTFYILTVSTTIQQDLDLIAKFNSMPNVNRFNAMRRNCADFTKDVINDYFPHAAHRNIFSDFGVSSPKGIARSFAHYANAHPDLHYYVMHFGQLPGTIKRSSDPREGMEQLYRSKKLALPLAFGVAYPEVPGGAAGIYFLTGRFNPEHEFEKHATPHESELDYEFSLARTDEDEAREGQLKVAELKERANVVGTKGDWKTYRKEFDSTVEAAVRDGLIADRSWLGHIFKDLSEHGTAYTDDQGGLWMKVREKDGTSHVVGVSASTVLAPASDRKLAFAVILANVEGELKTSPRRRETIPQFKQTWALLQRAESQKQTYVAQQNTAQQ